LIVDARRFDVGTPLTPRHISRGQAFAKDAPVLDRRAVARCGAHRWRGDPDGPSFGVLGSLAVVAIVPATVATPRQGNPPAGPDPAV